jgi:phosphorylcholine metabolism protein LicD
MKIEECSCYDDCMVLSEKACKKCLKKMEIDKLKNKIVTWEESVNTLRKTIFTKALEIREKELQGLKDQLKNTEGRLDDN